MVPFLYGPREHHSARSVEEYLEKHALFMARKAAAGQLFVVHTEPTPIAARVDANTWLVDCECGAGNATWPEWGIACCYGCGAIHSSVTFPNPDEVVAIGDVLTARPTLRTRAWGPGETVIGLVAENLDINADVSVAVVAFLATDDQAVPIAAPAPVAISDAEVAP